MNPYRNCAHVSLLVALITAPAIAQNERFQSQLAGSDNQSKVGEQLQVVEIKVQEGKSISTAFSIGSVTSANEEVCSASIIDSNDYDNPTPIQHFSIVGLKPGTTNVTVAPKDGFVKHLNILVRVTADTDNLDDVKTQIEALFPGSSITISTLATDGSIVLSGVAKTVSDRARIEEFFKSADEGYDSNARVINQIKVSDPYADMEAVISQVLPGADVNVLEIPFANRIVVSGTVERISDVKIVSQLLTGESGRNNSYSNESRLINNLRVSNAGMQYLAASIEKEFPGSEIRLVYFDQTQTILIRGSVPNARQIKDVERIVSGKESGANRYESNDMSINVINKLRSQSY